MFCKTFFRTLTDNVTAYVGYVHVQGVCVSLSLPTESNFTRGFLHALSIFRCLHAVSITRRFQSWTLTRCFRYTQIPYPHKRLYPPFPLHAHSVYPCWQVAPRERFTLVTCGHALFWDRCAKARPTTQVSCCLPALSGSRSCVVDPCIHVFGGLTFSDV